MLEFLNWLVVIPCIIMAIRFWMGVGKFIRRNQKTLGSRVERVRSAFVEQETE